MAGSFGFEHDKYEVSAAIGELELLPAVRNAPPTGSSSPTDSVAASRSPRAPDRHALHLAEVLQMALQPTALDKTIPTRIPPDPRARSRSPRFHEASRPRPGS